MPPELVKPLRARARGSRRFRRLSFWAPLTTLCLAGLVCCN